MTPTSQFDLTWILLKNTRQRTEGEGRSWRILRAEVTDLQLTSVDAERREEEEREGGEGGNLSF